MVIKTPWRNGYLIIDEKVDDLRIRSRNIELNVKPRVISINGVYGYKVYEGSVEKILYLLFKENIKPFVDEELRNGLNTQLKLFKLRYVKTFYGEYYSISLPEYFYINYVILTDSEVAVSAPLKHRIFIERNNGKYVAYIY